MIDPFGDEADPPRLDGSRAPKLAAEADGSAREQDHNEMVPTAGTVQTDELLTRAARLEFGRRPVVLALALLPLGLAASGCAHTQPACPTQPRDPHHCQHRFCRHYRG